MNTYIHKEHIYEYSNKFYSYNIQALETQKAIQKWLNTPVVFS